MTIPQVRGMYNGDRARKETLVEYGFRLPSALDNRPLRFDEFSGHINQAVYVSATPGDYELERSPPPAQQVIRPTGLIDPVIEVRPTAGQVDDLIAEIRDRTARQQRVLVTTLTKRMAEDLAEHLAGQGIRVNYLHSEIKTLDRLKILKDFRMGTYDVIVGVNLLREGLDMPEVSLIAILDADKEGFLRNTTTLIQTMGRAARNVNGHVILYADKETKSIKAATQETTRRRSRQEAHNKRNSITPTTIKKGMGSFDLPVSSSPSNGRSSHNYGNKNGGGGFVMTSTRKQTALKELTKLMERAIRKLDYDQALLLREQIQKLKSQEE